MRHGEPRDDVGGGTFLDETPRIERSNEAFPRFRQAVQLECRNRLQIEPPDSHELRRSRAPRSSSCRPSRPRVRVGRQVHEPFAREESREELRLGRIGGKICSSASRAAAAWPLRCRANAR